MNTSSQPETTPAPTSALLRHPVRFAPAAARPARVDARAPLRTRAARLAHALAAHPSRERLLQYLALRRFLKR